MHYVHYATMHNYYYLYVRVQAHGLSKSTFCIDITIRIYNRDRYLKISVTIGFEDLNTEHNIIIVEYT